MTAHRPPLADFLRARRAALQPEDVGLPRDEHRRVRGLRREEVALLASISAEYYLRLEQGRGHQPSVQVLTALSSALRLDDDARVYLHHLAHPSPAPHNGGPSQDGPPRVADGVRRMLDGWADTPAYVSDRNLDIVAVNPHAAALAPGYLTPGTNLVTSVFEAGADADYREDWEDAVRCLVSALRFHGNPSDARFQEIVGGLSMRDRDFRRMWARHDAKPLSQGRTRAHIPPFGWVFVRWQSMQVLGETEHFITTFFGDPGSVAEAALAHLVDTGSPARAAAATLSPRGDSGEVDQRMPGQLVPSPASSATSRVRAEADAGVARHTTSTSS